MIRPFPAIALPALLLLSACAGPEVVLRDIAERPETGVPSIAPVVHWEEILEHDGERVHFHVVRADLDDKRCEARVVYGDDPDGPEGPAVTQLVNPVDLVEANGLAVAVNANAFRGVPGGRRLEKMRGWYLGKHIIPVGQVVVDDAVLEGCVENRLMVWTDKEDHAHTGPTPDLATVRQGVSDWGGNLISNGVYVSENQGANHRSMAGTDDTGRWLFLLVADGEAANTRHSGASFRECADLLLECGCTQAIALDGGGSVTMVLAHPAEDAKGRLFEGPAVESSGRTDLRPVPVMFGLSARRKPKR